MEEQEIGKVTHYFSKASVAAIDLTDALRVGDTIVIKGSTTEIEQKVDSMQVEHQDIQEAGAGQKVGIKVKEKVRPGDVVYKK